MARHSAALIVVHMAIKMLSRDEYAHYRKFAMNRIALYMLLIYMSVSVSFQSCSNSSEPEIETNEVTINEPTNDYLVKANVTESPLFLTKSK